MTGQKASSRPAMANELRHQLANAISDFKAYDVPAVCERIGLAGGTSEEAFSSKYKYAKTRLASLQIGKVLKSARNLLEETENHWLGEAADKVAELDLATVSEITRRRIVALFSKWPLCTEIEEMDFLRRLWPIDTMPSCYYPNGDRKLAADIFQHTINNYDWERKELLEHLGIFSCSQAQFFKFLAAVTDPIVQKPEAQTGLVEDINALLVHDGYKLLKVRELSGCPFFRGQSHHQGIAGRRGNFNGPEDLRPGRHPCTMVVRYGAARERSARRHHVSTDAA